MENLLPEEIVVEILLRQPVKALLIFKSVSKQFLPLISDANFVERYNQGGFNRRVLLSSSRCLRLQSLDFETLISNRDENSVLENLQAPPQMGSNRPAKILGSCNGMVSISMGLGEEKIVIWNPSLGHYRIIQDTSLTGSHGFGCDSFKDDYKLIKVFAQKGSREINVDVFSLRANSWRSIRYENLNLNLVDKVGTFASGSIFWLVKHGDGKLVASVISFDVSKEKFCYVPLPDCGYIEGWRLGVLEGCLSACYCVFGKDAEAWMKKGTDAEISCWVKLGSVPQAQEAEYIRDDLVPLCFDNNGDAVVIKGGLKLYVCNLKKNTCKRIYFYDDLNEFEGALFVESLVSPNDYGAQVQKASMYEDGVLQADKEDSKVEKFIHTSF